MTFLFDRNMGKDVPRALRLLGLPVESHHRHFRHDTYDEVWLTDIGKRGWIVVTHDAHFQHNESERRALIDHGVGCFVLVGGQADKWSKVRLIAKAWDKIIFLSTNEPKPFIWQIRWRRAPRRLYP